MRLLNISASTVLGLAVLSGSSMALAHPGHDHFDSITKELEAETKEGEQAQGPVIFSSIEDMKQTSTVEVWAGLRYKAYYHLTITGKRNNNQENLTRTFTFEVANDVKARKRARRGQRPQGGIIAKTYARKISTCRNLAEKAMSAPDRYDLRVENRGRKSAACRLITRKTPNKTIQPKVVEQPRIAKRAMIRAKGSV